MPSPPPNRSFAIRHHLTEAEAWLQLAGSPPSSTALSYAGFELRLGLERLLLEYLIRVDGGKLTPKHLDLARSFKRGENRIYDLEGHQREIDIKFRLFEVMAEMLNLPFRLTKPHFGEVAARWHACSEFCHIGWTCVTHSKEVLNLEAAFEQLSDIARYLDGQLQQVVAWPSLSAFPPGSVPDRFLRGAASEDDLRTHLRETGLWSNIEYPDGRKEFLGTPVPPSSSSDAGGA